MAKPKKRILKSRKKKVRVNLAQRIRIVERNDATRVEKRDSYAKAPTRLPADVGANFKIKIRRKR